MTSSASANIVASVSEGDVMAVGPTGAIVRTLVHEIINYHRAEQRVWKDTTIFQRRVNAAARFKVGEVINLPGGRKGRIEHRNLVVGILNIREGSRVCSYNPLELLLLN